MKKLIVIGGMLFMIVGTYFMVLGGSNPLKENIYSPSSTHISNTAYQQVNTKSRAS